jgi:hypothetical protein
MRQPLVLIAFLCVFTAAQSQKAPIKYGDISDDILKMTVFPTDSSAEAVVLADYGESVIRYSSQTGFEIYFERTRRIKVLKEAGKKWADFSIQLYKDNGDEEKLLSIKGITVNIENGKTVQSKMDKDAIFREKYSKNIEIVKVTLPNVKVGSVFDITYKISSDFLMNFQDWDFQTTIPVVWSEYRAEIPEYFNYERYMQGYLPVSINEADKTQGTITLAGVDRKTGSGNLVTSTAQIDQITYTLQKFRWVIKDVPAFRDEPYLTTRNDYISRINFELASIQMPGQGVKSFAGSWANINDQFAGSEDFLGEVTGNGFLKKTVEELTAGATTNAQKVEILHNYVRQNVAWNEESRRFTQKTLRQVLEDKKGNSAEINLLLASMMEKAGLDVKPVLLSTRDHGFIREATPAMAQFNYVICIVRWDQTQLLLDATEPYLPAGLLPSRCLNGKGMAVAKTGLEWIPLVAPKTRTATTSDLVLSADGVLTGTLKLEHGGYRALEKRKKYFSEGADVYVKDLIGTRQWEITNSQYTNAKELPETFKETHDIAINEHITLAGDVMYMNPFISGQWNSNPFKLAKREYPVDFGSPFDEVYVIKVKLPAGYALDEMPAPKIFALPANAARYTMSSTTIGDVVSITSMLSVNKVLFTSIEYESLREFWNQVVAKQIEQIVIKKK